MSFESRLINIAQSLSAVTRYGAGERVFDHQQSGIVDSAQKALTDFLTATNAALITPETQRLIQEYNFVRGDVDRTALEQLSRLNRPIAEVGEQTFIHITPGGLVKNRQFISIGTNSINEQIKNRLSEDLQRDDKPKVTIQEGVINGVNGSQARACVASRTLEAQDLNSQNTLHSFTRGLQYLSSYLVSAASQEAAKNTFGTSELNDITNRTNAFKEAAKVISDSLR